MAIKKKFYKQRKWRVILSLTILLLAAAAAGQIIMSHNASASKQVSRSAVYGPPPNIEEIRKEVNVAKNLVYDETEDSLLDIYFPENMTENLPVILWIHGGGYIGGSKDSRQDYGMTLANAGYVVANINYALAPEQTYPGPILQANAALGYLELHAHEYGGDMSRLFIGGDSAGAQIASQVAAVISNGELAHSMNIQPAVQNSQLKGALLFCGLYNMQTVRATGFPNIGLFLSAYTGAEPFESFPDINELSTVNHITSAYPSVFITVGDADPFSSQSQELVDALKLNEIAVNSVFFEGTQKNLKHEYQYALDTADAQETLEKTLGFLFVNSK